MKFPTLACLTALALFVVPGLCEDNVIPQVTIVGQEDEVFSENNVIDVGRLLGDLLEDVEEKRSEDDKEKEENNNIVTDQDAIDKRNKFVDSFLARLSDEISHEPMKIIFKKSGKVVLRREGNGVNGKAGVGKRKQQQKRKWRRRFQRRGKKGKRYPKSLVTGEEGEDQGEDEPEEKEGPVINEDLNGLTYEDENDDQQEETSDLADEDDYYDNELLDVDAPEGEDDFEDDHETGLLDTKVDTENDDYGYNETDMESPREAKELDNVSEEEEEITVTSEGNTSQRVGKARRRRRKRKGGRGKCGKVCRRRRRIRRRRRKNQRKQIAGNVQRGQRTGVKPTAVITGISTLRRSGDVRIKKVGQKENLKVDLDVGPIVLQAQRAFKVGPGENIRNAEARTSVVKGKLVLTLIPDGVILKHLHLVRPKVIKVSGNLARKPGASSGRIMRTYLTKTQPLIVHKIRKAANRVLRLANGNGEFLDSTTT